MRIVQWILVLIGWGSGVFAQQSEVVFIKKIADEVMSNSKAYDNLRVLCKEIGPRLSGSIGAAKAVEATRKMLMDAGADTVYLQACWVPHWVRGEKETASVLLNNQKTKLLNCTSLGNSIGTGKKGIYAPVVEVNSFAELDSLGETGIKGKIVFYNFPMNPTYIETFRAYGESGAYRTRGPSKAAKYGAKAVLVRSLASNPDIHPHTGTTIYNDSFPKIPALAISTENAIWLSNAIKQKSVKSIYVRNTAVMLPDVLSYNVIGELRGSIANQEIITVGGHLDSWDLAEGAHDDGAGCVQSIEVIRLFKALGIRPNRTIRAVMFMNEENGGKGAKQYLEAAEINKENHLFALESDAGGFTPRGFSLDMDSLKVKTIQQWVPLFYPYGIYEMKAGGSGSDISPLKKLGTALAGLRPDSQRYFDIHHAPTDVFEAVSRRELHLGALNMTILIYLIDKYGL
ncbi:MAG: M20/M25/M40 family metallo-hydrolase [Ferruginibacter sp.]